MLRPRKAVLLILTLMVGNSVFGGEYRPGEVIVKYKNGVVRARSEVNALYDSIGVKSVHYYSGSMSGFEHLVLDDSAKVEDAMEVLAGSNSVEYVQPNYILHALPIQLVNADRSDEEGIVKAQGTPCWFPGIQFPPGCDSDTPPSQPGNPDPTEPGAPDSPSNPGSPSTRPNLKMPPMDIVPAIVDPQLAKAYGLTKTHTIEAWDVSKGSKDVIVADIDTGIDYNHDDLAFNIWRNPKPTDKNDVVGFDFVHNDGLPFDDNEHGTHTAGTIGAVGGNGIGISGVNQRVSLMSLKFLSGDGSGTTADAIRAIDYAINHGAKVLSNSWGGKGDPDNQALKDAIDRAKTKDVLFIAAAGNDGADNDGSDADYPAAFDNDNLIAVAATDERDSLAFFSNYGKKSTHLAAPGVNIYSTIPGGKYASLSGTSMACPHVAGGAALLWSMHPKWNYKKVKDVLMKTVDKIPALANKTISGGRMNVLKALNYTE
ncbi:MAG: S8 family peptidase [Bdellovibrionia bacterium]